MNAARQTSIKRVAALALAASMLATPGLAQMPPPVPQSPAPVTALEYDAKGNLTRRVAAPGMAGLDLPSLHQYDPLERLVLSIDARGGTTRLAYAGRRELTRLTDPRGLVTTYWRNGLGDLTGIASPDTGSSAHTFDAAGNLLARVDSRGATASYSYDALNRLRQVTYGQPGSAPQSYSWIYDQTGPGFSHGVGRLTASTFPGGHTRYAYDASGRLVSKSQTVVHSSVYSQLAVQYGRDAAGRVTGIRYPSGRQLSIPHVAGQPSALLLAPSTAATAMPLISGLQFTTVPGTSAQLRSWYWHLAGGTRAYERVHDMHGRIVRYPIGGAMRDLIYDAADRIVAYSHFDASTATATPAAQALDQQFAYDEVGRLVSVASSVGTWTYAYDANGNRTVMGLAAAAGSVTRAHQLDVASNRLLALSQPVRTLTYDPAGNIINSLENGVGWTATYGPAGRLDSIEPTASGLAAPPRTLYLYDADGLRVAKLVPGTIVDPDPPACLDASTGVEPCGPPIQPTAATLARPAAPPSASSAQRLSAAATSGIGATIGTVFVYGADDELLGEYDAASGAVIREYIWLQGLPLAVLDGPPTATDVYFLYNDHLGAPRAAIDGLGRQRWSWLAEPFGNSAPVTNPVGFGNWVLNLRMPGQYFDVESGMSYNGFRNYAAELGRYTQSDPIGLEGGINTYAYVGGNPISRVDPMGLLDRLVFDGKYLTGYEDVGVEFRVPAVSGPWGKGPLPEGVYMGRNLRNRKDNKAMTCPDGSGWSLDLDPTFKTPRDLLRIHPDGNVPGTEGCIGPSCGAGQQTVYDALRGYFREGWTSIPVIVRYPR